MVAELDRPVCLWYHRGMTSTPENLPVRDRILNTACNLFYRQGYRATGINQVIAASGVAKASFYDHFPSKEDLLYAYAQETARREFEELRSEVMTLPTARDRFFGPLRVLEPWFKASDYRGCPFQNLLVEVPPEAVRIRDVARLHRENLRGLFLELALEFFQEEPAHAPSDATPLVETYLLLFEGAIALSAAYRETWPVSRAISSLEDILAH